MELHWGNTLLYAFSIYHLFGGIFSLGPQSWTKKFGEKLYSLEFPEQFGPPYQLTVRSLGAFATFTGLSTLLIIKLGDERIKAAFLFLYGILFIGRAILRLVQKDLFLKAYNITFQRSLKNMIFNCLLAVVCWVVACKMWT